MSIATHDSPFLRRFDALWSRARRVHWGESLAFTGLVAVAALALLIAADYRYELPRSWRVAGLAAVAALTLVWLIVAVRKGLRMGTRPRTASEIERTYPQLGQSVRTTIQFGRASEQDIAAAGVRTALVAALADETHIRSRSLYLDAIVPTRTLWMATGFGVGGVIALLVAAVVNRDWCIATCRTLHTDMPYTSLSLEPGNRTVQQGDLVEVAVTIAGRTNRPVTLFTRPLGDAQADWVERRYVPDAAHRGKRLVTYMARLESVKRPLEYRALSGAVETETFQIQVRYPLALKQIEVEVTPPDYTGHPPVKTTDGNLSAVEGSVARFAFELDRAPKTASLLVTSLARLAEDEPAPAAQSLPLEIDGATLRGTLPLIGDQKYSILAESADGQRLPENLYRIRVRPDQPPEVYFEEPRDSLDVHTLAEVLMRIRVRDDFGLTKAGIVFEVNNEEEYPLLTEEFATAAEELKQLGKLTPETQAALEKVLPLEFFQLNQTDSVAYYAFAEDNYPDRPHRTVTDLRFIDIRPFRIQYRVIDPPSVNGMMRQGPKIATLEELINRQRFNLNRTMNIARKANRQEKIDLSAIDSVMQSETEIAVATRELADFLSNLMLDQIADEIQLLLQAETNMLAAVDSLSSGEYATAVQQERDALKELIEGRNRLQMAIMKNPKAFQSLQAADRRMAQKLRRPKSDKEEAQEIVRRLRQLAQQEEEVQMAMAGGMSGGSASSRSDQSPDQPQPNPDQKPSKPADAPKTEPSDRPPGDGQPPAAAEKAAEKVSNQAGTPQETPDGQGNSPAGSSPPSEMSPEQRREKQLDVVLESQDLEKSLGKLKNITDLARERMTEATKQAQGALDDLDRGDTPGALQQADAAKASFGELAQQVEGLLADEAAERLAAARNLANQLAQRQQQLAQDSESPGASAQEPPKEQSQPGGGQSTAQQKSQAKPPGTGGDPQPADEKQPDGSGSKTNNLANDQNDMRGKGKDEQKTNPEKDDASRGAALAQRAERNAETGRTVLDILQSVQKSTDPNDKDVIAKIDELMKNQKLEETVSRMASLPDLFRTDEMKEARVVASDSADRWEAAAMQLTVAFRQLSAPKLDELLSAEQKLQALREQLDNLKTEQDVVQWHVDAGRLMAQLEKLGIAEKLRDELRELLETAGWTEEALRFRLTGGGWILSDRERYGAPIGYVHAVRNLTQEVQAHIQELLLGELLAGQDEATPPQYEQLVERYYQVLAKETVRRGTTTPSAAPTTQP